MTIPKFEDAHEALRDAEARQAFWKDHYADLPRDYRDQFVAVYRGEVVATAKNHDGLLNELRARGLRPTDVWVRLITADPHRLMH